MYKRYCHVVIAKIVFLILIAGAIHPVRAQENNPNTVSFFQIGESEIILKGPYDSQSILFGLPSEWSFTGAGQLNLLMTVSFSKPATADPSELYNYYYGGAINVTLNDTTLAILPLTENGQVTRTVDIPLNALISKRLDGRMELELSLDSGIDCNVNQNMQVVISTSSQFTLPHNLVAPDTSLVNFPRPIYQDSLYEDRVLIVIPEKPTDSEMQGVLTLASGMGNLTGRDLLMELVTIEQLTAVQKSQNNLIFVGKSLSLPLVNDLSLPVPLEGSKFKLEAEDDGLIAMVNSPWAQSRVVMLVSGNTDVGVVKASRAVSTGLLRPNISPNLSIVKEVELLPIPVNIPIDQTLADLGYDRETLDRIGVSSASYNFFIPPGQMITTDAYFELAVGHSALLEFERSGLVILLNNQPIGSVRFTDETSRIANNIIQIPIPPAAVLTGNNRLEITSALYPIQNCSTPNFDDIYAVIWPESRLHLPLRPSQTEENFSSLSLDNYPAPFSYDPNLGNLAFVLPENDSIAWRVAFEIVSFLGDRADGSLSALQVYFANSVTAEELAAYNLVLIGRPSELPLIKEINDYLPMPFPDNSDVVTESNMQVIFRISPNAPTGYIELLESPWNPTLAVLLVSGNSPQGLTWAGEALVEPVLRSRLSGNFVAVTEQQLVSVDTRLSALPQNDDSNVPENSVSLLPEPAPLNKNPTWILSAALIAAVMAGLILIVAAMQSFLLNRNKQKK